MPEPTTLIWFAAAAAAMQMMPGPATLYISMRSLEQGLAAGLASVLGIVMGVFVHVLAAMLGISAILMTSVTAFTVVKFAGAAYLIYLGIQTLCRPRDRSGRLRSQPLPPQQPRPLRALCRQGVLVNALNPKAAIFFLSFLPQFVAPERGPVWGQILILGMLFAGLGVLTGGLYVLIAAQLGRWLQHYQRARQIERYVSGGTYIALGAATAFDSHR
ncbi:MAG: LysE family translocator [Cyanobacteria bacterium J06648_16]